MDHVPESHAPVLSLWPIGVAVGVACALVAIVIASWWIVAIGVGILVVFGGLWIYDVSRERHPEPPAPDHPEAGEHVARAAVGTQPATRKSFLAAMTLGLGAGIGALVTIPSLVFAGLPPFKKGEGFTDMEVDLGPLESFKEDEWLISKFNVAPSQGDVADRTAFVRYNGLLENERGEPEPSFTIISNRCVHLGCPVQANGPVAQAGQKVFGAGQRKVAHTPVLPAGFGCPCHGAQYDTEGNRTAGPPVRALDRYAYEVRDGKLVLVGAYSVNEVEGSGKDALIGKYRLAQPGVHVDGVEQLLYPFIPPS